MILMVGYGPGIRPRAFMLRSPLSLARGCWGLIEGDPDRQAPGAMKEGQDNLPGMQMRRTYVATSVTGMAQSARSHRPL
jgi:hypothetical protein